MFTSCKEYNEDINTEFGSEKSEGNILIGRQAYMEE
jgi:hypothetical protein